MTENATESYQVVIVGAGMTRHHSNRIELIVTIRTCGSDDR